MAEQFTWGLAGKQDLSIGHASFDATLPDGTTGTLDKINLSAFYSAYTVSFSATPTFDLVNGVTQTITLTGNVTSSTITATAYTLVAGTRLVLRIIQDGTGGRTFVWPTNVLGGAGYLISTIASASTFAELQYNGTNWEFAAPPEIVTSSARGTTRLRSIGGTALVAGDFALSSGWGTTASVGTITGTDQRCQFTVTSAGTGQAANPTITLTFKDGTWTTTPFALVLRNGGAAYTFQLTWTVSATQLVITFNGQPIAAETFTFTVMVIG